MPQATPLSEAADFEVWLIDQSDTTAEGGGTLYIYPGDSLTDENAAAPTAEVIDLGGEAGSLCLEQTGTFPKRPHMLVFNAAHSHAILAFVATGHVLFIDAVTRAPLTCLDADEQAHAAFPSPDETYVVVANQNGKLLQRVTTDYAANAFALEDAATLNLATCTTPSGAACEDAALRPDNAPICPVFDNSGRFVFVTLRGGGLLVVDSTAMPMAILAEYDAATARGVYLVVYVTVTNTTLAPALFPYDSFTVTDGEGRLFTPDSIAIITILNTELGLSMYEELQPGLPYSAAIVFDVPLGAAGFTLGADVSNTFIPLGR